MKRLSAGITRHHFIAEAARVLEAAGVEENARRDAKLLLSAADNFDALALISQPDAPVQDIDKAREFIRRRAAREPVSRIIGQRGFWNGTFTITKDVLDPRPDTETLVQTALNACTEYEQQISLVDLGTGSGCILLSLLSELPVAQGIGVDLSAEALAVASQNAAKLGLEARATFRQGSWWSAFSQSEEPGFDVAVSNPPYIPSNDVLSLAPEVQNFDPPLALDGGEDGLACYRAILQEAARYIRPGGSLILELGIDQSVAVSALAEEAGLSIRALCEDLNGIPRTIWLKIPQ